MVKSIGYELSRSKEDGGKTYFIHKNFDNGVKILWARFLLRSQAIEHFKKWTFIEGVPGSICPGVFRRKK